MNILLFLYGYITFVYTYFSLFLPSFQEYAIFNEYVRDRGKLFMNVNVWYVTFRDNSWTVKPFGRKQIANIKSGDG